MTVVSFTDEARTRTISGDLFGEPITAGATAIWDTQERALRDSVLVLRGRGSIGGELGVVLTGDVAAQVRWLRRWARGAEGDTRSVPAPLTVNAQGAWDLDVVRHPQWRWVLIDIAEQDDELLSYGPGGVERQHVRLTVARWSEAETVFRRSGRPLTSSAQVKGTTKVTAKDAKYGLVFVSVRLYGTAGRVGDLMRLNKITDPKRLKVGQTLKLP